MGLFNLVGCLEGALEQVSEMPEHRKDTVVESTHKHPLHRVVLPHCDGAVPVKMTFPPGLDV